METRDIISLGIAGVSVVVSIVLGTIKIRRDQKQPLIMVDYVSFYETAYLNIINRSNRLITIVSMSMNLNGEPVPINAMFSGDSENIIAFPKQIPEFGSVKLELSSILADTIHQDKTKNLKINVYDIEGKIYSKYRIREINGKLGGMR